MPRREFPAAVRRAAFERADGTCECGCDRPFGDHPKERPTYDHAQPDALGGKPTLENCRCIRVDCHGLKTSGEDMPRIAKARRGEKARIGIEGMKRKIPGSKGTGWRKPINGNGERRNG